MDFWDAYRTGPSYHDELKVREEGGLAGFQRKYGRNPTRAAESVRMSAFRGGLSALLPVEATPHFNPSIDDITVREEAIARSMGNKALEEQFGVGMYEKMTTRSQRSTLRGAGRFASRWAGPIIATHRLGTEVDITQGASKAGFKASRIIGEEVISTSAAIGGMALGGKIGASIGTVAAPGVGSIAGMALGIAGGLAVGAVGGWAWNKVVDVAEGGYGFGQYLAKQHTAPGRLELGGGVSRGNRTRMAYTMRSRALQQMNRSGQNARRMLGQEAAFHHIR